MAVNGDGPQAQTQRHKQLCIRGCQDKYPISWATVIANKTTMFDVILPEQLGILTK